MKILLVADYEMRELWDYWEAAGKRRTEGVELILSAGDIKPQYLEFLVTMLNVPCLYVRGNHDGYYDVQPPRGCIDINGKICELRIPWAASEASEGDAAGLPGAADTGVRILRVAGLGGSMRYHDGLDMYTEREMARRVRSLKRNMRLGKVILADGSLSISRDLIREYRSTRRNNKVSESDTAPAAMNSRKPVDILLTHAPSLGHGDMDDLPHRSFACFNNLIEKIRPVYHCYGHVHPQYDPLKKRKSVHPAGTQLINAGGMYILEI